MASAKVDNFEPVWFLRVGERNEPIAGPNFVLGGFLRVLDLGLDFGTVGTVELGTKDALRHLTRHALPGKPQLNLLTKFTSWFPGAPDQRAGVKSWQLATFLRPVANALDDLVAVLPFLLNRPMMVSARALS